MAQEIDDWVRPADDAPVEPSVQPLQEAPVAAQPVNDWVRPQEPQQLGFWESLGNSAERGARSFYRDWQGLPGQLQGQAMAEDIQRRIAAGEDSVWTRRFIDNPELLETLRQQYAENAAQALPIVAEQNRRIQDLPQHPAAEAMQRAQTWGEAWDHFTSAPLQVIANIGLESLVQQAPSLAAGAVAGGVGGLPALMATIGLGSAHTEYMGGIFSALSEEGVDITNPEALRAALLDQELMGRVRHRSAVKAGVVGLFDAGSAGLASRVLLPAATFASRPVARHLTNVGVQVPVQGAMGGAGEALGSVASGQDVSPGAVMGEIVGEAFGAPAEVAAARHARRPVPQTPPVGDWVVPAEPAVEPAAPTPLPSSGPQAAISGFYAPAERAIESLPRRQGPAQAWLNDLKKSGVSNDELDWMGFPQFMEENRGRPISREEMAEFIRENGANLVEVRQEDAIAKFSTEDQNRLDQRSMREFGRRYGELNDTAQRMIRQFTRIGDQGGFGSSPYQMTVQFRSNFPAGTTNPRNFLVQVPGLNYVSPHFGGPTVSFIRVADTVGPNGEKTLLVHGNQSELHQEAERTSGYRSRAGVPPSEVRENSRMAWDTLDREGGLTGVDEDALDFSTRTIRPGANENTLADLRRRYPREMQAIEALHEYIGVPHAPLKGDRWWQLGLKLALRQAVAEGYDAVAISTADQVKATDGNAPASLYDQKMPTWLGKYVRPMGGGVSRETGTGRTVVPITPKMRESISKGQPLFAAHNSPTSEDAQTRALNAVNDGETAEIPIKVADGILNDIRSGEASRYLRMVPSEYEVGSLVMLEPAGENVRAVFLTTNDTYTSMLLPRNAIDSLGALHVYPGYTDSGVGGLFFLRFDLPGEFGKRLAGELRHEAGHALRSSGKLSGQVWQRLLGHARSLSSMGMSVRDYLFAKRDAYWQGAPETTTVNEAYSRIYSGRPDFQEVMDQEHVMIMLELHHHGHFSDEQMAPVRDIIDAMESGAAARGELAAQEYAKWEPYQVVAPPDSIAQVRKASDDALERLPEPSRNKVFRAWQHPDDPRSEHLLEEVRIAHPAEMVHIERYYDAARKTSLFSVGGNRPPVDMRQMEDTLQTLPPRKSGDITISTERDYKTRGSITYVARNALNQKIGTFRLRMVDLGQVAVTNAKVQERSQRKGVATRVYDMIAQDLAPMGITLRPQGIDAGQMSDEAFAFWMKRDPSALVRIVDAEVARYGRLLMGGEVAEQRYAQAKAAVGAVGPSRSSGPAMAIAGPRAKTASKGNLAQAQKMAQRGRDPNTIWEATGWGIDPADSKWKWEIDDSKAKLINLTAHLKPMNPTLWQRLTIGKAKLKSTPRWATPKTRLGTSIKLPQILQHPELYRAYPFLQRMSVNMAIGPDIDRSHLGGLLAMSPGEGKRTYLPIRVIAASETEAIDTLLHEIQHYIQYAEGFPPGASFTKTDKPLEVGGRSKATFSPDTLNARVSNNDMQGIIGMTKAEDLAREIRRLESEPDSSDRSSALKAATDRLAEVLRLQRTDYMSAAGEIEAEAVVSRRNLTPLERRENMPFGRPGDRVAIRQLPSFPDAANETDRRARLMQRLQEARRRPVLIGDGLTAVRVNDNEIGYLSGGDVVLRVELDSDRAVILNGWQSAQSNTPIPYQNWSTLSPERQAYILRQVERDVRSRNYFPVLASDFQSYARAKYGMPSEMREAHLDPAAWMASGQAQDEEYLRNKLNDLEKKRGDTIARQEDEHAKAMAYYEKVKGQQAWQALNRLSDEHMKEMAVISDQIQDLREEITYGPLNDLRLEYEALLAEDEAIERNRSEMRAELAKRDPAFRRAVAKLIVASDMGAENIQEGEAAAINPSVWKDSHYDGWGSEADRLAMEASPEIRAAEERYAANRQRIWGTDYGDSPSTLVGEINARGGTIHYGKNRPFRRSPGGAGPMFAISGGPRTSGFRGVHYTSKDFDKFIAAPRRDPGYWGRGIYMFPREYAEKWRDSEGGISYGVTDEVGHRSIPVRIASKRPFYIDSDRSLHDFRGDFSSLHAHGWPYNGAPMQVWGNKFGSWQDIRPTIDVSKERQEAIRLEKVWRDLTRGEPIRGRSAKKQAAIDAAHEAYVIADRKADPEAKLAEQFTDALLKAGYDSVILREDGKPYEMVAIKPGTVTGEYTGAPMFAIGGGPRIPSALSFIREHGGIKDENGELKAILDRPGRGSKGYIVGIVNNKTGVPLDRMRELMVEAGYIQRTPDNRPDETSIQDVLDIIRRIKDGEKVAPLGVEIELLNERDAAIASENRDQILREAEGILATHGMPYDLSETEEARLVELVEGGMAVDDALEQATIETINGRDESEAAAADSRGVEEAGWQAPEGDLGADRAGIEGAPNDSAGEARAEGGLPAAVTPPPIPVVPPPLPVRSAVPPPVPPGSTGGTGGRGGPPPGGFRPLSAGGGKPPGGGSSATPPALPSPITSLPDGRFKRMATKLEETLRDSEVRVRQLVQRAESVSGLKLDEQTNPYTRMILYHGRAQEKIRQGYDQVKELTAGLKALADAQGTTISHIRMKLNVYLLAQHTPERNRVHGDMASGMDTAYAARVMQAARKLAWYPELKRLADIAETINKRTLTLLADGRVISAQTFGNLLNAYKHHVPLNRIMEEADDVGPILGGRGFDVAGTGIKRAKGSEREVADIVTNIVTNYEQAVLRSEKNIVDLATLKFMREFLGHMGGQIEITKPSVIGTKDKMPIYEHTTDEKILKLREDGKPVWIKFKDPALATAFRGTNREQPGRLGLFRVMGAFTRAYAQMHTRFNPEFALPNKLRDLQETLIYVGAQRDLGGKGVRDVLKNDLQSQKDVLDFYRGLDTPGTRLYQEMKELGGTTGGFSLSTREQVQIKLDQLEKLANSVTRRSIEKAAESFDAWNAVQEDSTRLSVYKASLAAGLTKDQAAVYAKEASINFNRFGTAGPTVNAAYMFANASMQGTWKMFVAMRDPKVAATVGLMVAMAVAAAVEWNDWIDPEWRQKITKWDRQNNLNIMLPRPVNGVNYIKIPVAWGVKPLMVMANYAYDTARGVHYTAGEMSWELMSAILQAYNPLGGTNAVQAFVPSILDTTVDIYSNQRWSGAPIRPTTDRNAPRDTQYYSTLKDTAGGRAAIAFTNALQQYAGISWSPADVHYAVEQYAGGVGRFILRSANLGVGFATGGIPPAREWPFLSRFYTHLTDEEIGRSASRGPAERARAALEDDRRRIFQLRDQADDVLRTMQTMDAGQAEQRYNEILDSNRPLARQLALLIQHQNAALTATERRIIQMDVNDGTRARYLVNEVLRGMTGDALEDKLAELRAKRIVTPQVAQQIYSLMDTGETPEPRNRRFRAPDWSRWQPKNAAPQPQQPASDGWVPVQPQQPASDGWVPVRP